MGLIYLMNTDHEMSTCYSSYSHEIVVIVYLRNTSIYHENICL